MLLLENKAVEILVGAPENRLDMHNLRLTQGSECVECSMSTGEGAFAGARGLETRCLCC